MNASLSVASFGKISWFSPSAGSRSVRISFTPFTAEKFIDYVYQPEVQADIAEYVNYICPVNGVKEILVKRDRAFFDNQLIFPDEAFLEDTFIFRGLKPEEEAELDDAFQRVIGA